MFTNINFKAKPFPVIEKFWRRGRRNSDVLLEAGVEIMGQYMSRRKTHSESERDSRREATIAKPGCIPTTSGMPPQLVAKYAAILKERGVIPDAFLVHEHASSKYVDEDGDVANEFYTEREEKSGKRKLQKVVANLRPQGTERYRIPRLRSDLPVVMWEMKTRN